MKELAADWYPDGLLHDYVWNKIKVEVDDDEDDEYSKEFMYTMVATGILPMIL